MKLFEIDSMIFGGGLWCCAQSISEAGDFYLKWLNEESAIGKLVTSSESSGPLKVREVDEGEWREFRWPSDDQIVFAANIPDMISYCLNEFEFPDLGTRMIGYAFTRLSTMFVFEVDTNSTNHWIIASSSVEASNLCSYYNYETSGLYEEIIEFRVVPESEWRERVLIGEDGEPDIKFAHILFDLSLRKSMSLEERVFNSL